MRGLVAFITMVVMVAAKPAHNHWMTLSAADGQFVLTQDDSLERGVPDMSLEYVRPYKPGAQMASGKPHVTYRTGGAGAVGQHNIMYSVSSEELLHYLANPSTQGQTHTERVQALMKALNTGLVDFSGPLYQAVPYSASNVLATDNKNYYIDTSGEIYYLPDRSQGGQHGAHAAAGAGVHVAKK